MEALYQLSYSPEAGSRTIPAGAGPIAYRRQASTPSRPSGRRGTGARSRRSGGSRRGTRGRRRRRSPSAPTAARAGPRPAAASGRCASRTACSISSTSVRTSRRLGASSTTKSSAIARIVADVEHDDVATLLLVGAAGGRDGEVAGREVSHAVAIGRDRPALATVAESAAPTVDVAAAVSRLDR